MQRIEREDRVIYVERHRRRSLAFFVLACVTLALAMQIPYEPRPAELDRYGRRSRDDAPTRPMVLFAGAGFLFLSVYYLFDSRAFVIEVPRSSMTILERRFLSLGRKREFPIQGIQVTSSAVQHSTLLGSSGVRHWIWLEIPGQRSILFEGNIRDWVRFRDTVAMLREDLQRPTASQLSTE